MRTLIVATLLALLTLPGMADAKKVTVLDAETFRASKEKIESDIDTPGVYPHLDDEQRAEVRASLEKIMAVLEEHGASDKLDGLQKVELVNNQEIVNQILTNRPVSSRHVCRYERPTGTRRMMVRCQTLAEIEQTREAAKGAMHGKLHSAMEGDGV